MCLFLETHPWIRIGCCLPMHQDQTIYVQGSEEHISALDVDNNPLSRKSGSEK